MWNVKQWKLSFQTVIKVKINGCNTIWKLKIKLFTSLHRRWLEIYKYVLT